MQVWPPSLKPQGLMSPYPRMQVKYQGHIFVFADVLQTQTLLHYSSHCRALCMLYYLKCQLVLGLTLFTVNLLYSVQHIHSLIKKKGHPQ